MESERETAEYYAKMLVVGHTGGVDVSKHNLDVIELAMKAGIINALDEFLKAEAGAK